MTTTAISPYTMRRVRCAYVEVVGTIWMPAATSAMRYELSDYDLGNISDFTRENVDSWLGRHAGDFQAIKDFHAVCGDTEIAWADEENECVYQDCMYPSEE